MAANYIIVRGYIRNGELIVDLPENVQDGEIEVLVSIDIEEATQDSLKERVWTEAELDALINPQPKTGAEIVALGHTGGWADKGITDSLAWLQEQRRKRRERRAW